MAQPAESIILRAVKHSPAKAQYNRPRSGPPLFYKPRFELSKEAADKTLNQPWLKKLDPLMPAYPYLKHPARFPEANNGLYGGATVQSGNKISKGRNKGKTKRLWFPNVKVESVRSQALKETMTIPMTARVKRKIKMVGGLDEYVLGGSPERVKQLGLLGWKLRWKVKNALVEAGTPDRTRSNKLKETFEDAWNSSPELRQELIREQVEKWDQLREKDERFRRHMEVRIRADGETKPAIPTASRTLRLLSPDSLKLENLEIIDESNKDRASRKEFNRVLE